MSSILGISGSPVKNSNTDHVVKAILEASGLDYEFVKLSELNVGSCRACKACVGDNICKVEDDFPSLAEKVKKAKALVIGGYTPYGMIDGFIKSFLERLWSMRHVNNLNRGKLVVTVMTGLTIGNVDRANKMIALEMIMEHMEVVGQLRVNGNVPCLTCGHGDACDMSAVRLYGKDASASTDYCVCAEDQPKVWEKALRLGRVLGDRVRNGQFGSDKSFLSKVPLWRIPLLVVMMLRSRRWTVSARRYKKTHVEK